LGKVLICHCSWKLKGRVQLYTGDEPIFDYYKVEQEIEKSLKRKVWLRSGGQRDAHGVLHVLP